MQLQKISEIINLFFQSIFSIIKVILLSKFFVRFPKVDNEECVILGNGPSLNKDIELAKDFIFSKKKICVNFFGISNQYEILQPEYYVLAAPEYWLENNSGYFQERKRWLRDKIKNTTNWKMILLIPFQARNSLFCSEIATNQNVKTVFYNNTPVEGFKGFINLFFSKNLGMPRPHNVLIPSIYLAINLGFKKIDLFGADHSWHEDIRLDDSNRVTVNHEHFYDSKEVRLPMHKLDGEAYFIHDIFRKLHFAFKGYFILQDYAATKNVEIINSSSKSYIDAFNRS